MSAEKRVHARGKKALVLYVVTLTASVSKDVEIHADSPEEAVRLAEEQTLSIGVEKPRADSVSSMNVTLDPTGETNDTEITEREAWECVGRCEVCSSLILTPIPEPEGYVRTYSVEGEDGIYVCKGCSDAG